MDWSKPFYNNSNYRATEANNRTQEANSVFQPIQWIVPTNIGSTTDAFSPIVSGPLATNLELGRSGDYVASKVNPVTDNESKLDKILDALYQLFKSEKPKDIQPTHSQSQWTLIFGSIISTLLAVLVIVAIVVAIRRH